MVARDGIEPPTPAFSGPRSTTELSGLGITLVVGDRQEPPRVYFHLSPRPFSGELATGGEPATQTHSKYSNPEPYRQLVTLALSFLIAHIARTPMLHRLRLSVFASLLLSFTAIAPAQTSSRPAIRPSTQAGRGESASRADSISIIRPELPAGRFRDAIYCAGLDCRRSSAARALTNIDRMRSAP